MKMIYSYTTAALHRLADVPRWVNIPAPGKSEFLQQPVESLHLVGNPVLPQRVPTGRGVIAITGLPSQSSAAAARRTMLRLVPTWNPLRHHPVVRAHATRRQRRGQLDRMPPPPRAARDAVPPGRAIP